MQLSQETLNGIKVTGITLVKLTCYEINYCEFIVKSFIEMTKYLFGIPDVKCFLSRNICQDPLEKFFGVQRADGSDAFQPQYV